MYSSLTPHLARTAINERIRQAEEARRHHALRRTRGRGPAWMARSFQCEIMPISPFISTGTSSSTGYLLQPQARTP